MSRRLDLGVDLMDGAILIDKVGYPAGALILATHKLLEPPDAISGQHLVVFITEHGICETLFLHELALFGGRIGTNADNLNVSFLEFPEFITESLTFDGSARGIGFGEEPENHFLPPEVLEGYRFFISIRQGKIRGW
jgi:hypothetical protein